MTGKHSAAGSSRNYGYGRDMAYAGHQALMEYYGGGHFQTVATHANRFRQFAEWAKKELDIRDIAKNDPQQLLEDYAARIGWMSNEELLSAAYAQNLISSAQVVLRAMTGRDSIGVKPARYCKARSNVRTAAPASLDRSAVNEAQERMHSTGLDRAAAVVILAREFGMREREAILADLGRLNREASEHGRINVQDGAKGGRTAERWVPVAPEGRAALDAALAARPEGSKNLLSPTETYRQFVAGELRAGRSVLKAVGIKGYHDCRAGYACDRYRELTGHPAPVVTGARSAYRSLDRLARQEIMAELGHGRIDVSVSYIGGQS